MLSRFKLLAVVGAVAALMGGGIAWASLDAAPAAPQAATAATRGRGGIAPVPEAHAVAITPCRIVDTRKAGGTFSSLEVRSYQAIGTGSAFNAQGGLPGGCGIPDAATAVQVSITAVGATGVGYLRAYPALQPEPTATFMNYGTAFNATGAGLVALCHHCGAKGTDMSVKVYAGVTHVVIDVSGYLVKPLEAVVNANGTLARGERVATVSTVTTGFYSVKFDREVALCAWVASVGDPAGITVGGFASTSLSNADIATVVVKTYNATGALAAKPFHLYVSC
ncbi:MAG: N-acetylmuramoyl-L-alanine amidase family 2 [Acidimicrobiales bacterium]|nr:N-acetylmuramoyl-L-alanine amidase family 2 [Acidimicrobiales bacterium]